MNPKFFNQLGLAMRAGKLVTGDEGVFKAIRSGKPKLSLWRRMLRLIHVRNLGQMPILWGDSHGNRNEV